MPGLVAALRGSEIRGCAWHPHFQSYRVLVHLVAGRHIVASVVAEEKLDLEGPPAAGIGHGFTVDLDAFDIAPDAPDLRFLIGETDEWFGLSATKDRTGSAITVEEIIAVPRRRTWVCGKIYFDALLAGLSVETIVDLFFRDCLERPADPGGLEHYSGRILEGTLSFEALRAILVKSQEYKLRWHRADTAPGAIFSQRIVLRAGNELNARWTGRAGQERGVSLRELISLSRIEFIAAAYLELLGALPAPDDLWGHVVQLRCGRQRLDIIRELCGRPAALARPVRWSDLVLERETPPPAMALPGTGATLPTADLRRFEGTEFVTESCRRILGRPPSAREALFLCHRLARSRGKEEIIDYLAGDPEAIGKSGRPSEPSRAPARPAVKPGIRTPAAAPRAVASASARRAARAAAAVGDK